MRLGLFIPCCSNSVTPSEQAPRPRERNMSYVELNPSGTLSSNRKNLKITLRKDQSLSSSFVFTGKYAYILGVDIKSNKQFLLLKPFEQGESNHGAFLLFKKNIPGYTQGNINFVAGGEIAFKQGVILWWDLKSAGFSKGTKFDEVDAHQNHESAINFDEAKARLWLPNTRYIAINHKERLALDELFNKNGSFAVSSSLSDLNNVDSTSNLRSPSPV